MTDNLNLFPAATAIQSVRDAGYSNAARAIAELIDNSIEANANHIRIILEESGGRLSRVLVYDDGDGMPPEVLQMCLQFGNGTRMTGPRKGMGRFGVGLPQASASQCKRFTVCSWQGGNCNSTYLDIDEVIGTRAQDVNRVEPCGMPEKELGMLDQAARNDQHGTLVVWENCDRLTANVKRAATLHRRLEKEICRVYRHYLDDDEDYGRKVDIASIDVSVGSSPAKFLANDPMFLLTPNNIEGYRNTQLFAPWGPTYTYTIDLPQGSSEVEMRFSHVLPEFHQKFRKGTKMNRDCIGPNTGISVVRLCREIGFGNYGFFNPAEERERWWGCEVRFKPDLDEVFGVTNNKQAVTNFRKWEHSNDERDFDEIDDTSKSIDEFWRGLRTDFVAVHTELYKRIKRTNDGTGSKKETSKSTEVANNVLGKSIRPTVTSTASEGKSEEEIKSEVLESARVKYYEEKKIEFGTDPTEEEWQKKREEIEPSIAEMAKLKVDFEIGSFLGGLFYDIQRRGQTSVVILNSKHKFFSKFNQLLDEDDKDLGELATCFRLLLLAHARAEEVLSLDHKEIIENVQIEWSRALKEFLDAYDSP